MILPPEEDSFTHQLTKYARKSKLKFAERQLKQYGAKEGVDYVWKKNPKGRYAIFLNGGLKEKKRKNCTGVYKKRPRILRAHHFIGFSEKG